MTKICVQCKIEKGLNYYYVDVKRKDDHRSECKACCNLKSKAWRVENPNRAREWGKAYRAENRDKILKLHKAWRVENPSKARKWSKDYYAKNRDKVRSAHKNWSAENQSQVKNYQLQKNYGITLEQYDQMFAQQNGLCAVCDIHRSALKKALNVDHNHTTGVIRGLLCNKCNQAIGLFKDSVKYLEKAIKYLKGKP